MKPVTVDATTRSAVVICNQPGCGARDISMSRSGALVMAARHYDIAHPGKAREADQLRRRATATRGD
jgi:hypothetical protein